MNLTSPTSHWLEFCLTKGWQPLLCIIKRSYRSLRVSEKTRGNSHRVLPGSHDIMEAHWGPSPGRLPCLSDQNCLVRWRSQKSGNVSKATAHTAHWAQGSYRSTRGFKPSGWWAPHRRPYLTPVGKGVQRKHTLQRWPLGLRDSAPFSCHFESD